MFLFESEERFYRHKSACFHRIQGSREIGSCQGNKENYKQSSTSRGRKEEAKKSSQGNLQLVYL
jgi:hypothetical protein